MEDQVEALHTSSTEAFLAKATLVAVLLAKVSNNPSQDWGVTRFVGFCDAQPYSPTY